MAVSAAGRGGGPALPQMGCGPPSGHPWKDALGPTATEGQSSYGHFQQYIGHPGAVAPLVAPGSINMLPLPQKTSRDNCKVSWMKPADQM